MAGRCRPSARWRARLPCGGPRGAGFRRGRSGNQSCPPGRTPRRTLAAQARQLGDGLRREPEDVVDQHWAVPVQEQRAVVIQACRATDACRRSNGIWKTRSPVATLTTTDVAACRPSAHLEGRKAAVPAQRAATLPIAPYPTGPSMRPWPGRPPRPSVRPVIGPVAARPSVGTGRRCPDQQAALGHGGHLSAARSHVDRPLELARLGVPDRDAQADPARRRDVGIGPQYRPAITCVPSAENQDGPMKPSPSAQAHAYRRKRPQHRPGPSGPRPRGAWWGCRHLRCHEQPAAWVELGPQLPGTVLVARPAVAGDDRVGREHLVEHAGRLVGRRSRRRSSPRRPAAWPGWGPGRGPPGPRRSAPGSVR